MKKPLLEYGGLLFRGKILYLQQLMKRLLFCIAVVCLFQKHAFAQSYGLIFSSHEVVQEKRTSLDLSPDDSLCFSHSFDLNFDLNFLPHHQIYFGYVLRIIAVGKDGNDQNVDLIYDNSTVTFKVIVGENFSSISFSLDSTRLYRDWNAFAFHCDLDKHLLQVSVNGRSIGSATLPPASNCFKFLWGANDFGKFRTRDIPPMQLKDIRLAENGSPKYNWPLDEAAGETATDKFTRRPARVKNPGWLKPRYQQWDPIGSFTIKGNAGVAYDPTQDRLFIVGSDSIGIYSLTKDGFTTEWVPAHHADLELGHQNIYDTLGKRLLHVFIDRKTVSTFNFAGKQWDQAFPFTQLTRYWHANKFISPADSSLYIIGGYGQLHYRNAVQRYRFDTRQWDTAVHTTGDTLLPRYLSALGTDAQGKYAYIVGGYGSKTGNQMLDPRNYYDLIRFDIRKHIFKKLFSLKPATVPFTFANSLVVDAKPDTWYGLFFPNDSYNSKLQLIEGSLTDSTFRLVGNSIPYTFHDIQSFADLYYSQLSNKLIAVTLFSTTEQEKEHSTQVRVYTLNYPPEPVDIVAAATPATTTHRNPWIFLIGITGIVVIAIAAILRIRSTSRPKTAAAATSAAATPGTATSGTATSGTATSGTATSGTATSATATSAAATSAAATSGTATSGTTTSAASTHTTATHATPPPFTTSAAATTAPIGQPTYDSGLQASAIYLFGPFQAFDREGHDCTRLFTPLLKELFLIITTYTLRSGRGISSEGLNELLWHDKADKDAKNNRSVNLAKLKPILEKIGNCSINKEAGYWQLQVQDDTYVDYKTGTALLQDTTVPDGPHIHALVHIIKRGPFLFQTEYNWLDDIKSEVSNAVIDRCLSYLRHHDITENPEFTIEIANCIFYFDQLNEDALTFKCKSLILLKRHNLASNTYLKFAKDYRDIYSAEFDKTFQVIIA
jgi:hypothetical protein